MNIALMSELSERLKKQQCPKDLARKIIEAEVSQRIVSAGDWERHVGLTLHVNELQLRDDPMRFPRRFVIVGDREIEINPSYVAA